MPCACEISLSVRFRKFFDRRGTSVHRSTTDQHRFASAETYIRKYLAHTSAVQDRDRTVCIATNVRQSDHLNAVPGRAETTG